MNTNNTPRTVLTYQAAITAGYQPREYSYDKELIPTGEYHVLLDFMTWAMKLPAVDLSCTIRQTGQHIFTSINLNLHKMLREAYLWHSRPAILNDPFDCYHKLLTYADIHL